MVEEEEEIPLRKLKDAEGWREGRWAAVTILGVDPIDPIERALVIREEAPPPSPGFIPGLSV